MEWKIWVTLWITFQKAAEATGDLIGDNTVDRITEQIWNSYKIKEYPKKDTYLQKKNRKLLMAWDKYNSIIMEYQKL